MYTPPAFALEDSAAIERIMAEEPFGQLITADHDGLPTATHIPLLFAPGVGAKGAIQGHMARQNPHLELLRQGRPSLAIFWGPHAYVSPTWYERAPNVPTWNYLTVHVTGRPRIVEDETAVRAHMERLVATFEDTWRLDGLPESYLDGMLKGIVAFEIEIERIQAKAKLSQNRKPGEQQRVREALAQGGEMAKAVARWMAKAVARWMASIR